MTNTPVDPDLVARASALGVVDALLFRRVTDTTWAHLGGLGRGRAWAGIVDVDDQTDPLAARIPERPGQVNRLSFAEPTRVMGPYYAIGGAVVRITHDVAVVLGNPHRDLADGDDDSLRELAAMLEHRIDDVRPSKRLADELEVLHAVRALMQTPTNGGLDRTLLHLVRIALRALTCEIGVLRYGNGHLAIATPQDVTLTTDEWNELLDAVDEGMSGTQWCAQDVASMPTAVVAEKLPMALSLLALRLPDPVGGLLVAIHTERGPRGFTSQCQRLARHVVGTGSVLAHAAALHDDLRASALRAEQAARTDPLTGLGNRLAWDEAVAAAQERVDAGATVSVLTLDVDGLKEVNDAHGHDAGDDLLRRAAAVMRQHCEPGDVIVRMGGDEFAILLSGHGDGVVARFTRLAEALGAETSGPDTVAASVGYGTARPGGRLADAVRDADVWMYERKRQRRLAGQRLRPL